MLERQQITLGGLVDRVVIQEVRFLKPSTKENREYMTTDELANEIMKFKYSSGVLDGQIDVLEAVYDTAFWCVIVMGVLSVGAWLIFSFNAHLVGPQLCSLFIQLWGGRQLKKLRAARFKMTQEYHDTLDAHRSESNEG